VRLLRYWQHNGLVQGNLYQPVMWVVSVSAYSALKVTTYSGGTTSTHV
jgi:hypothetical protein